MRYLFILVMLILIAACGTAPDPGSYYIMLADTTITPDFTYCDGNDCWYVAYFNSATPRIDTQTPIPTNTVVSTIAPTNGPVASPTPVIEPTATQEIIPTPSPIPTLPPLKTCKLRGGSSNYNIRAKPGPTDNTNPAIGSWLAGTDGEFNGFAVDTTRTYWWAHWSNNSGWSAVGRYLDTIQLIDWFVYGLPESELCKDVIGWPAPNGVPVDPPAPIAQAPTALLWHAVTNANGQEMLASYSILNPAGILGGVKPYVDTGRCIEALESGNICIYRWPVLGTDCPNLTKSPTAEGERWMRTYDNAIRGALFGYASTDRLFIEVTNECDYGQDHIERLMWWSVFMDSAMDYVNNSGGWPRLVMPTFGPGHGSELLFRIWKPQLVRLAAMKGLLGDHTYTPWHNNGLCSFDEWLAARSVKNHEWMEQNGYGIDIAITEAAKGWGNDPVDANDFVCWFNKISQYPYIHSVALWTAGHHPTWPNANLNGYMIQIALGVIQTPPRWSNVPQ